MSNVVKLASVVMEPKHEPRKPRPIEKMIGEAIRTERMKVGISQEELGEGTGISFQQWGKIEKGENRLYVSRLLAAAAVVGFNPGAFVNNLYGIASNSNAMAAHAAASKHLNTPGAVELIGLFNALTPERRRIVLRLMRELAGDDGKA